MAIIINVETLLANKIGAEMGKLDDKFSRNFYYMSGLHSQLFDIIQNQDITITNHLSNIDNLPDQFRAKVE
jgi:hypothetical protein